LIMEGRENTGYLLVADYDAPTKLIKSRVDYTHGESELTYQLQVDQTQVQVDSLKSTYQVTQSNDPSNKKTYHTVGDASLSQHLNVNHSGEVYNITIDVEGKTKAGKRFKRTVVESINVNF